MAESYHRNVTESHSLSEAIARLLQQLMNLRRLNKLDGNMIELERRNLNQTEGYSLRANVEDQQKYDEMVAQFQHVDETSLARKEGKMMKQITDKLALLEFQTDSQQAKIDNLQENEKILMKKNQSLTAEVARLKSQRGELIGPEKHTIEENKQLRRTLQDFQEKDIFLRTQIESLRYELVQFQSLTAKLNNENTKLKKTVQEHMIQVEDEQNVRTQVCDLQQSICVHKDQLEMRQEEERQMSQDHLHGAPSKMEESQHLNVSQFSVELPQEELHKIKENMIAKVDDTTPENQRDERIPEASAAAVQTKSSWFSLGKRLLKVGLTVGVGIAGVLLTMGIYGACADSGSNFILEPGFHYIEPPPF